MGFPAPRGATFLSDIETYRDDGGGAYRRFLIATPLGDLVYRFVEKRGYAGFAPEFEDLPKDDSSSAPDNRLGFQILDHITSNAQTMAPVILWYREVMGFSEYWNIQFHTEDVKKGESTVRVEVDRDVGSGLGAEIRDERAAEARFSASRRSTSSPRRTAGRAFSTSHCACRRSFRSSTR